MTADNPALRETTHEWQPATATCSCGKWRADATSHRKYKNQHEDHVAALRETRPAPEDTVKNKREKSKQTSPELDRAFKVLLPETRPAPRTTTFGEMAQNLVDLGNIGKAIAGEPETRPEAQPPSERQVVGATYFDVIVTIRSRVKAEELLKELAERGLTCSMKKVTI